MRTGAHALSLLSVPLNMDVLTALAEGPQPLLDLRRAVGSPPQTTMRAHLRTLTNRGVLERRGGSGLQGSACYELSAAGSELLSVARVLQAWLANSPNGPLEAGSPAAKSVIKAFTEGWSSTIVRALAARPLALSELSKVILSLNYPAIERRLEAMRLAGQIERCPGDGRGRPYGATRWLRTAIGPLAAGARWERRHSQMDSTPIGRIDIESIFLLTVPMLTLPSDASGSCRFAVELGAEAGQEPAGVLVRVEEGRIVSCVSRRQGPADAWAIGSPQDWLGAVIEGEAEGLEYGGDCELFLTLLDRLNETLFAVPQRA